MFKLKNVPFRVWLLLFVLLLALLAINPSPNAKGIEIKTIEQGVATDNGLSTGQILLEINGEEVKTLEDFNRIVQDLEYNKNITITTDKGEVELLVTNNLGFELNNNLTVEYSDIGSKIEVGSKVQKINGKDVENLSQFNDIIDEVAPKRVYKIKTNKGEVAFLARKFPHMTVGNAATSNIKKGLDLEGGTRVLLKPISDKPVDDKEIDDIIKVLSNRLNVYGLTDLKIREAKDWSGEKYILIEIAGVSKEEVTDVIAQQGKFEAKIGNEVVFEGGKEDIPFVCRNDGTCSGIRACSPTSGGYYCKFEFVIHLSADAAKRHANITKNLNIITSDDGREILEKNIDFYLDGSLVDSLNIASDLKGSETTAIAISGPGTGVNRDAAIEAALKNMDKLQTVLITGSLPYKLEIVKLDSISPVLGKNFVRNSLFVGLIALIAVALVIYVRYRTVKILLPMMFTSISEVVIILGFAALIEWNLDVAAIAGILAAIGTGVDDQIVIIDETIKGETSKLLNWKQKLKNAFFIIFAAYATTVAAMVPLWNAGAGLIRGFAITTIVGVSIGVFITRPAFAAIAEKMMKD